VEGEQIRVWGIWAKNRDEWLTTQIASWYNGACVSGFYDSMNDSAVIYIIVQTEMTCMFAENKYISKLVGMKKSGKIPTIKHVISYEPVTEDQIKECQDVGMTICHLAHVEELGNASSTVCDN